MIIMAFNNEFFLGSPFTPSNTTFAHYECQTLAMDEGYYKIKPLLQSAETEKELAT